MRIILILPCCIGDVVLATAALRALRRAYPDAHIAWAVGTWSRPVLEGHDTLNALVDTGPAALPVKSPLGFLRLVSQLRAGRYDLAVSFVRSPLMSLAVQLSGIPARAGLDSEGRGFGYTVRVPVDPAQPRHEAELYLEVVRALGIPTEDCWANVPVQPGAVEAIHARLAAAGLRQPYLVVHPGGGRNPGMTLDAKRWPPEHFAALANRLSALRDDPVIVIGGPGDTALVQAVMGRLERPGAAWAGELRFAEVAALAKESWLYLGNDTGMTHLAAAAGARAVMILGPSDPKRYAPFTPGSLAVWKPAAVDPRGVSGGAPRDWDWARDGIGVDEAYARIQAFLLG
ncbi:MAG: glycosyltransferase family 9 protein [Anaerolineae bacterium]|nr:glycosyltransferase family 9 protein [Anaerolineae bacterium]